MRLFRVNTTEYEEEDFFLLTDLTEQDITEVVQPIIMAERDGYEEYENETLLDALRSRYPNNKITMIVDFEELIY
jgi:hypothetical protein